MKTPCTISVLCASPRVKGHVRSLPNLKPHIQRKQPALASRFKERIKEVVNTGCLFVALPVTKAEVYYKVCVLHFFVF